MSELKSFIVLYDGKFIRAYKEYEADKVIAELKDKLRHYPIMVALLESDKKEIAELKKACKDKDDWCLHTLKENRHHKYKRCLAMARWCFTKSNYHFVLARHGEDAQENNRMSVLYSKWNKRWLKIAEKFKPNSTAQ